MSTPAQGSDLWPTATCTAPGVTVGVSAAKTSGDCHPTLKPADWAPKQHCLVGGFREILANCGAAVSIWTTGTTAVQLGASTTTIAGGQFSLTFTFTFT